MECDGDVGLVAQLDELGVQRSQIMLDGSEGRSGQRAPPPLAGVTFRPIAEPFQLDDVPVAQAPVKT